MFATARKSQGNVGVFVTLMMLQTAITPQEYDLFCSRVPDGLDIISAFHVHRANLGNPNDYGFLNFVHDVINSPVN